MKKSREAVFTVVAHSTKTRETLEALLRAILSDKEPGWQVRVDEWAGEGCCRITFHYRVSRLRVRGGLTSHVFDRVDWALERVGILGYALEIPQGEDWYHRRQLVTRSRFLWWYLECRDTYLLPPACPAEECREAFAGERA